ncbi:MAG TPA: hypothetical protein EYQ50_18385, partial [Verrucomicrobiales bacterium]|nr:hypothetical protein [Verrucomicrobiales bacterium]
MRFRSRQFIAILSGFLLIGMIFFLRDNNHTLHGPEALNISSTASGIEKELKEVGFPDSENHLEEKPDSNTAASSVEENPSFGSLTELVLGLDQGVGLRLKSGDPGVDDRHFVMRPKIGFLDITKISLGFDEIWKPALRVYEGIETNDGMEHSRIMVVVVNNALTATITESGGSGTTTIRTRTETGLLEATHHALIKDSSVCSVDESQGVFLVHAPEDSSSENRIQAFLPIELEPTILELGGFDPATGQLDKYINVIPNAPLYETSLKDMLLLAVLDKRATGSSDAFNLAVKSSQYLARLANVATVYENQLGIRLIVQELIMIPDLRNYDDIPGGLEEFRDWCEVHRNQFDYGWTSATKWGGGLSGTILGAAYIRNLRTDFAVSVQRVDTDWITTAHEIGHNLGSSHTNGGIMNAVIDGKDGRTFFTDVTPGETSAKLIYDYSVNRLHGDAELRHPEEIPFAINDFLRTNVDTPVQLNPLRNDLKSVRNGLENTLSLLEVGRVFPLESGTVEKRGQEILFTPTPGFIGTAWFSYTLQGDIGGNGKGWLHKGDVAVIVGRPSSQIDQFEIPAGGSFSFLTKGNGIPIIQTQPDQSIVSISRDDGHLILIRVDPDASGTDPFRYEQDNNVKEVVLVYRTDFPSTQSDVVVFDSSEDSVRFFPLNNDQGAGTLNPITIRPRIGVGTGNPSPTSIEVFPGAFRLVDAVNLNPEKGILTQISLPFTLDGEMKQAFTGELQFDPFSNETGIVQIEYTVEDGSGRRKTDLIMILLPLVSITSPSTESTVLKLSNGLVMEGVNHSSAEPPLSGNTLLKWTEIQSPSEGSIVFEDPEQLQTSARFTKPGVYVIQLEAVDNGFHSRDEITVIVESESSLDSLDSGLKAFWKSDRNEGGFFPDETEADFWGILVDDAHIAEGRSGGGLLLDGDGDFVDFSAHAESFTFMKEGTISLWFKTTSRLEETIFSFTSRNNPNKEFRIYTYKGRLGIGSRNSENQFFPIVTGTSVSDGLWHQVIITVDSNGQADLYLDGAIERSGPQIFFGSIDGLDSMDLGRTGNNAGGKDYFTGSLDHIRIYDHSLEDAQVEVLSGELINRAPVIELNKGLAQITENQFTLGRLEPEVRDGAIDSDLITRWKVTQPSQVTVLDFSELKTASIVFGDPGFHRIRLEAEDESSISFDERLVLHMGSRRDYPGSLGLPEISLSQNSATSTVALASFFYSPISGSNPESVLNFEIVGNSNPELFDSLNILADGTLNLTATSNVFGSARIILRATDSQNRSVDEILSVEVKNHLPSVPSQSFTLNENSEAGEIVGTIKAVDPDEDRLTFSIIEQSEPGVFQVDADTGELIITDPYALDFERTSHFNLKVGVSDSFRPFRRIPAEVTIHLRDIDEPPVVLDQEFELLDGTAEGAELGSVQASDPEGQSLVFTIQTDPSDSLFVLDSLTGLLSLNKGFIRNSMTPSWFDLEWIAAETDGAQQESTGRIRINIGRTLIASGIEARYRVPTNNSDDLDWFSPEFQDSRWNLSQTAFGYELNQGFELIIKTDLRATMANRNTTLYIRIPFDLEDRETIGTLKLRMKYDDGFIAYLNGTEVGRRNAPAQPDWSSSAVSTHDDSQALVFEELNISRYSNLLVNTGNVLAIHGLNRRPSSSDFLILPELVITSSGSALNATSSVIRNGGVSEVTDKGARISSELINTGGLQPEVFLVYGIRNGGLDPNAWHFQKELGTKGVGRIDAMLDDLAPGTLYYYRWYTIHSGGIGWSEESGSFSTRNPQSLVLISEESEGKYFIPTP